MGISDQRWQLNKHSQSDSAGFSSGDLVIYGLVGKRLEHSWSKSYFERKFREENITGCRYDNFQIRDIAGIKPLIDYNHSLSGFNVTIPFKEQILPYLDKTDPVAEETGSVNAVRIVRQGTKVLLEGFNTDAPAFLQTLQPLIQGRGQRALILGTGGAGKAVQYAIKKLGISAMMVSRYPDQGEITYDQLTAAITRDHQIIVNATPLGMFPDTGSFPSIPYEAITSDHLLYDLVYNPEETIFLQKGRMAGARVKNGLEMLHLQAEMSWKIWREEG